MNDQSGFRADFAWQKQYEPLVRHILGELPNRLFTSTRVASREADMKLNADVHILPFNGKDVGIRLRRPGYLWRYGFEFTIRSERRVTKAETELAKLRRGLGDWFFYGHIENMWSS